MRKLRSTLVKYALAALLSVTLAAGPALAAAQGNDQAPRADAMIFDALLLRPLGLVSTVFGGAVFIVSLPFTVGSGSTGAAVDKLVGAPLQYTFTRPLGQIQ